MDRALCFISGTRRKRRRGRGTGEKLLEPTTLATSPACSSKKACKEVKDTYDARKPRIGCGNLIHYETPVERRCNREQAGGEKRTTEARGRGLSKDDEYLHGIKEALTKRSTRRLGKLVTWKCCRTHSTSTGQHRHGERRLMMEKFLMLMRARRRTGRRSRRRRRRRSSSSR